MEYQEDALVEAWSLPYLVTVDKDDTVSKVRQVDGTTQVHDENIIRHMRTVDQTFNLIKDSWPDAASVTVTYHAEKGHPTVCKIDMDIGIADENINIQIKDVNLR